MNDLTLSLVVIVLAAVAAAFIFLIVRGREKARTEELSDYCLKHGYELTMTNGRTSRELSVTAGDWRLDSSMQSTVNVSGSGSSEWQEQTEWVCERYAANRPLFALHCSGTTGNMDVLPAWVRAAALEKMRRELGGPANALNSVRTAFTAYGMTGIVFEPEATSAQTAMERLEPQMAAWKKKSPLYIESSPERVRIRMPGLYITNAEQLDRAVGVGQSLE